jgi:hypothetical protein
MNMQADVASEFSPTHKRLDTGEAVKATRWRKDGDHPLVERYPIERREYKGLLVVGPKEKLALRFGDWIVEDAQGRIYVVDGQRLKDAAGKEYPSRFEVGYEEILA